MKKIFIFVYFFCFLMIFYKNGKGEEITLFKKEIIPPAKGWRNPSRKEFKFKFLKEEGLKTVLRFKARIESKEFSTNRYKGLMKVYVNNEEVSKERIVNRPLSYTNGWGNTILIWMYRGFVVPYSPAFEPLPLNNPHYPIEGFNPFVWEFEITDMLKNGENSITILHNNPRVKENLIIADGKIENVLRLPERKREIESVKEQKNRIIVPEKIEKFPYRIKVDKNGEIKVIIGPDIYPIVSKFLSKGKEYKIGDGLKGWKRIKIKKENRNYLMTLEGPLFNLERTIVPQEECIEINDKIVSKIEENIGIIITHGTKTETKKFYLMGRTPRVKNLYPAYCNPTSVLIKEKTLLGFLAEDDVFRVHSKVFYINNFGGISDEEFVLKGKGEYKFKWSIFPLLKTDYYSFINAVRRKLGVNFTIPGSFGFVYAKEPFLTTSIENLRKYLRNKAILFPTSSISPSETKAKIFLFGTNFKNADYSNYKMMKEKIKKAAPESKYLIYFHCFIDTNPEAKELFKDSIVLNSDGKEAVFMKGFPLFFPTLSNSYGKEMEKMIDLRISKIGADGIYWDEFNASRARYHYGKPWDGYSADLDSKTGEIIRYKSSVILLTQKWRMKMVEKILKNNYVLVANFPPATETETKYKFPRFTETASITALLNTHLYTPIGLGDSLTEKNDKDCYEIMREFLDYGCLYYWYNSFNAWQKTLTIPEKKTLVYYMYPITPLEIHSGYIIGKERILTNRSGTYGWDDKSVHEVHIFGKDGTEIDNGNKRRIAKSVIINDKTFTEIDLPEGYTAVIIRKK